MSDIITCPLPPEGLREGTTPLRLLEDYPVEDDGVVLRAGERFTFIRMAFDDVAFVTDRMDPGVYLVPLRLLAVDIVDATGRTHVDRWITRLRMDVEASAHLYVTSDGPAEQRHIIVRVRYTSDCWPVEGAMGTAVFTARDVPALGDLDPDDKRLLPDGSSMLAALVRKAIVEHLLAQRSTG